MTTETKSESLLGAGTWCVVELLGHRRLGAFVTEVTLAGAGMLRLDVPAEGGAPALTQIVAPTSVYCLTPCTEEAARAVARANAPRPVQSYELPRLGETPAFRPHDDDLDEDGETEEFDNF